MLHTHSVPIRVRVCDHMCACVGLCTKQGRLNNLKTGFKTTVTLSLSGCGTEIILQTRSSFKLHLGFTSVKVMGRTLKNVMQTLKPQSSKHLDRKQSQNKKSAKRLVRLIAMLGILTPPKCHAMLKFCSLK